MNKKHSYLIIGAGGAQARAVALYLARLENTGRIMLADLRLDAVMDHMGWLAVEGVDADRVQLEGCELDASGPVWKLANAMRPFDVVINCAGNSMNVNLTHAAILAGVHYVDMGHDTAIVAAQFELSQAAVDNGVTIMPGCGIAPGGAQVLAKYAIEQFESNFGMLPTDVEIRCGGIPQRRHTFPLDYVRVFSMQGLVTECALPTQVLVDGRATYIDSLVGIEEVTGIPGFDMLEATPTGGNSGTLTRTYAGKIKRLNYKTLRWPGHWQFMQGLAAKGLFSEGAWLHGGQATARDATAAFLDEIVPPVSFKDPDALILRVSVSDKASGARQSYTMVDRFDPETELSAMQRTTGFSTAIVAAMLADGTISERGTLTQELGIPTMPFLAAWQRCGFSFSAE